MIVTHEQDIGLSEFAGPELHTHPGEKNLTDIQTDDERPQRIVQKSGDPLMKNRRHGQELKEAVRKLHSPSSFKREVFALAPRTLWREQLRDVAGRVATLETLWLNRPLSDTSHRGDPPRFVLAG
jgi:hypothetical protein